MNNFHYTDPERYSVFYSHDPRFVKINADSAANLMYYKKTDIPYLWYKFLLKFGLACVAGESDCGKSAFLRQLAVTVRSLRPAEKAHPLRPVRPADLFRPVVTTMFYP